MDSPMIEAASILEVAVDIYGRQRAEGEPWSWESCLEAAISRRRTWPPPGLVLGYQDLPSPIEESLALVIAAAEAWAAAMEPQGVRGAAVAASTRIQIKRSKQYFEEALGLKIQDLTRG